MRKLRNPSREGESVTQLLTGYFGIGHFPTDKNSFPFEILETHLVVIAQLPDPVPKIKVLLSCIEEYDLNKDFASRVCVKCWEILLQESLIMFVTKEQTRMIELQREINRGFAQLESYLSELIKLAKDYPKPMDYSSFVTAWENLGEKLSNLKIGFARASHTDPKSSIAKAMQRERPSGQTRARTQSSRRAIIDLVDMLHENIKVGGGTKQTKKSWIESDGFPTEACRQAFEILRCFGIDMKSADNLRVSYEKWKIDMRTNK